MANQYKSFYLSEILQIIDKVAIELMMTPANPGDAIMKDRDDFLSYNNNVAWNNEGIHDLAFNLKAELIKEAEDDD